jgi:hypothetical protein
MTVEYELYDCFDCIVLKVAWCKKSYVRNREDPFKAKVSAYAECLQTQAMRLSRNGDCPARPRFNPTAHTALHYGSTLVLPLLKNDLCDLGAQL